MFEQIFQIHLQDCERTRRSRDNVLSILNAEKDDEHAKLNEAGEWS